MSGANATTAQKGAGARIFTPSDSRPELKALLNRQRELQSLLRSTHVDKAKVELAREELAKAREHVTKLERKHDTLEVLLDELSRTSPITTNAWKGFAVSSELEDLGSAQERLGAARGRLAELYTDRFAHPKNPVYHSFVDTVMEGIETRAIARNSKTIARLGASIVEIMPELADVAPTQRLAKDLLEEAAAALGHDTGLELFTLEQASKTLENPKLARGGLYSAVAELRVLREGLGKARSFRNTKAHEYKTLLTTGLSPPDAARINDELRDIGATMIKLQNRIDGEGALGRQIDFFGGHEGFKLAHLAWIGRDEATHAIYEEALNRLKKRTGRDYSISANKDVSEGALLALNKMLWEVWSEYVNHPLMESLKFDANDRIRESAQRVIWLEQFRRDLPRVIKWIDQQEISEQYFDAVYAFVEGYKVSNIHAYTRIHTMLWASDAADSGVRPRGATAHADAFAGRVGGSPSNTAPIHDMPSIYG